MDEISDILKAKPKKKIPLLKNGSCLTLQTMKFGDKSMIVTNTCAFDSLCQNILIICYDVAYIQSFIVQKASSIPLFNMIVNILKTGLIQIYPIISNFYSNFYPIIYNLLQN